MVEVATGDTVQVTQDGEKDYSFGFRDTANSTQQQDDDEETTQGERDRSRDPRVRARVEWSPDSKAFTVSRNDSRKVKELYLVNVLANPRPTLSSYKYAMPGEEDVSTEGALRLPPRRDGAAQGARGQVEGPAPAQRALAGGLASGSAWCGATGCSATLELVEFNTASLAPTVLLTESVENAFLESSRCAT